MLLGSALFPNLDLEVVVEPGDPAIDGHAVVVGIGGHSGFVGSPGIIGPPGPPTFVGFLQRSISDAAPNIARYAGLTEVIYGEDVVAGDLLALSTVGGDEGKVVPWVAGVDGHTHAAVTPAPVVRHIINVVDMAGLPILGGVDANFTCELKYETYPTMSVAPDTPVVTEIADGDYWVEYVPTIPGVLYRLKVAATGGTVAGGIVTPWEFQGVPRAEHGPADAASLRYIVGQAWTTGVAGSGGVMLIRTQLF